MLESYLEEVDLSKFIQREQIAENKKRQKWLDEMHGLLAQPGVSEKTKERIRAELEKANK